MIVGPVLEIKIIDGLTEISDEEQSALNSLLNHIYEAGQELAQAECEHPTLDHAMLADDKSATFSSVIYFVNSIMKDKTALGMVGPPKT